MIKKNNKIRRINYERFQMLKHPPQCTLVSDEGKVKSFIVGRLVLSTFHPNHLKDKLCASHIDGNVTNNKLRNLEWLDRAQIQRNKKSRNSSAVRVHLKSKNETLEFESIKSCLQYLSTKGVAPLYDTVALWCRSRKTKHGFQFEYADQSKYQMEIPDLIGEVWKSFYTFTSAYGRRTVYYISNQGRVKSIGISRGPHITNKYKLLKQHILNGYCRVQVYEHGAHLVHRLVAEWFISNPNGYKMVDHIDGNRKNNKANNLRWVQACTFSVTLGHRNPTGFQEMLFGACFLCQVHNTRCIMAEQLNEM